jgi:hypothetical protein
MITHLGQFSCYTGAISNNIDSREAVLVLALNIYRASGGKSSTHF